MNKLIFTVLVFAIHAGVAAQKITPLPADKTGLEASFLEKMQSKAFLNELTSLPIVENYVELYESDIYIQKGGKFVANDFRSDFYLRKTEDGNFTPLFEEEYPIESFITLFNCKMRSNIRANVTVMKLDGKRVEQSIALDRLQMLLAEGNHIYSGLYSIHQNWIRITVIYHNFAQQYINMLVATADLETLFTGHAAITADLYLYIPREDVNKEFDN